MALKDELRLEGTSLKFVSRFTYLGFTLTPTGTCFSQHIKDRTRKAVIAAATIRKPNKLSLTTAFSLFNLKIAPTAAYGIVLIWKYLTFKDLRTLEGVKAHFLKRLLSVSRKTKNRLVYILSGASSFVTDLKETFNLEPTASYALFLEELEDKLSSVDPEIYNTPAMQNDNWKTANWSTRHVLKRHAVHGYHNLLRKRRQFSRAQRKL